MCVIHVPAVSRGALRNLEAQALSPCQLSPHFWVRPRRWYSFALQMILLYAAKSENQGLMCASQT